MHSLSKSVTSLCWQHTVGLNALPLSPTLDGMPSTPTAKMRCPVAVASGKPSLKCAPPLDNYLQRGYIALQAVFHLVGGAGVSLRLRKEQAIP